ncbi:MAG TPA: FHA domain-containing protein [Bryobacteraceae bacterium]|nr:FHA domain-containing protein [Bryobacteraceae bacterium]
MSLLRRIEQTLDKRLRALFGGSSDRPGAREGIELYRDALDRVVARATAGKRGDRLFPFDLVRIELAAHDTERKAVLEALFDPNQMSDDIRAALLEERITAPARLTVVVQYPADAQADLRIFCEKAPTPEPANEAPVARPLAVMWLITLSGVSSAAEFLVDRPQINIGREREVIDSQGRAVRRNDLHFDSGADDANSTVSRSHAHIRFDSNTGEWRIFDDGSSLGTTIFRDGRRIEVPPHAPRGAMLRPGDEIYLGQARLLFASPR